MSDFITASLKPFWNTRRCEALPAVNAPPETGLGAVSTMAITPVAVDATDKAVETPDPWAFPPHQSEGGVVSLTGHHALFAIDEIVRRLADRALMPASQVTQSERQLIDDVLAALLPVLDYGHRAMLCERFLGGTDVPAKTVRLLAGGDSDFSKALLEKSPALCALDLVAIARDGLEDQQIAVARRKNLSPNTVAVLAQSGKSHRVLKELLANESTVIPEAVLSELVRRSAWEPELVGALLQRPEMGPALAFRLFWSAGPDDRVTIAKKFSVDRHALEFGSIPDMENAIDSLNPATVAALEIITGSQRPRAFDAQSAVDALEHGHADQFFEALADGAGVSRNLVKKIVADASGEPLAILCKALKMGRSRFVTVLKLFQQAWAVGDGGAGQEERLTMIYDSLSVDRADLILRYWNYAPDSL